MPTGRELKKYLGPLLARRPDLAYHDRTLFFLPLTHYYRGVVFWTSTWAKSIKFDTFCDMLFDGAEQPTLGGRHGPEVVYLYHRFYPESWQQDPEGTWQDVFFRLEQEALPQVHHIDNPVALDRSPIFSSKREDIGADRILGPCALGKFDEAEELLDFVVADRLQGAIRAYEVNIPDLPDEEQKFHFRSFIRLYYLRRVFKRDRAGVIPLLHEWEAYKVRKLKLEKFWTPTPFPCER
jgi:hypothetical protein